jgi:hypothetical protein
LREQEKPTQLVKIWRSYDKPSVIGETGFLNDSNNAHY